MLSVNIPTTILSMKTSSTASAWEFFPSSRRCSNSTILVRTAWSFSRIKHSLSHHNLFLLLLKLFFFPLCLFPIFVSNLGKYPPMSLLSHFILIFLLFDLFFNLFLYLIFTLLNEWPLKPLFKSYITYILFLSLLESFLLVLLSCNQGLVLDMNSFLTFPFKLFLRSLLHSDGFFFLLLY